jgi:16S rRNA (guanine527-N7)-methyltransferase
LEVLLDFNDLLIKGASQLGVALTGVQVDAFAVYLAELLKWNAKTNLTAIDEPGEVLVKHFLDSLTLVRMLPKGRFRAADIGSGAGFPGLALKVVLPEMELVSVEPARRKAAFQRQAARLMGLKSVTVLERRLEDVLPEEAMFDVVLSRAFKEPGLLLPGLSGLLAQGGRVVLSVGPEQTLQPPEGWTILASEKIILPFSEYSRTVATYIPA